MDTGELSQWVIYDHPSDFPDCFVIRRWVIEATGPVKTADILWSTSLETLRDEMQRRGLYCLPRFEEDDPKIVEVWM
jgi:hypothetical protein